MPNHDILHAIIAGDFPYGSSLVREWGLRREIFFGIVCRDRKKTRVNLRNNLLRVEVLDRNTSTYRNPLDIGMLIPGPFGTATFDPPKEHTSTSYHCACYLKDGRKFLAEVTPDWYRELLAEAFNATGNKLAERESVQKHNTNPDSIFCMSCGTKLPKDAFFCKNCGKRIK